MATYGANVLTGGTASASTDRGGTTYAASKAVDANESTRWATDDYAVPGWWRYDLGSGVTKQVQKVGFVLKSSEITGRFVISGSNNGTTWVVLYRGWGTGDQNWQYYTFYNATAYRYYQIDVLNAYSGVVDSISEIQMYELTDATGVTLSDYCLLFGGTLSVSSDRGGGYPKENSIDSRNTSRWATVDGVTSAWWRYDLGSGVTDVMTKLEFITVSTEIPHAFIVQGSNDGTNWDTLLSTNSANSQGWQSFTVSNTSAYRYYQMAVATVWAGAVVSISEIRFWAARTYPTPGGAVAPFRVVVIG
jgi:hypothetical protein